MEEPDILISDRMQDLFLPFLKISLSNPYLNILDFTTLFFCRFPYEKFEKKNSFIHKQISKYFFTYGFIPSESTFKYGSKNRPWPKGLNTWLIIACAYYDRMIFIQEKVGSAMFNVLDNINPYRGDQYAYLDPYYSQYDIR